MKTHIKVLSVTGTICMFATPAVAKSSNRTGLNFGTSAKVGDSSNTTFANSSTDKNTNTKSSSNAFTPYVGYAFSELNLGLVGTLEQNGDEYNETSKLSSQQTHRRSNTTTKSLSLFTRFNFGKVMFMEGGMGVYNQATNVHTDTTVDNGSGQFNGQSDDYTTQGSGTGYHIGGGLEIPVTNGFYFTAAYIARSFQLRDMSKGGLGENMASQQKRELMFGIAYYD